MTRNTETLDSNLPTYDEVENEEYSGAPFDETTSKYKAFTRDLYPPDHKIIAVNSDYLCTRHTVFFIKKGISGYSSNSIVVYDSENKEIYSCKKKSPEKIVIYDNNKTPIINTRIDISFKNLMTNFFDRFFISSGKDFDKKYGTILASRSNVGINEGIIYTVTFTNIATGEEETLEIRNQKGKIKQSHLFYIYCNVGKENETMICKIKRYIKKLDMKYTIEVAPGVDY
eukprot:jgi/Orpsp1_1/1182501/evm.model.c7180000081524.1